MFGNQENAKADTQLLNQSKHNPDFTNFYNFVSIKLSKKNRR